MRFNRCPKAWLLDDAQTENRWFADVQFFKSHRILPRAGGMLDQDPRWIEALGVIDAAIDAWKRARNRNG